jgi:type VI secretion system protein ImpA
MRCWSTCAIDGILGAKIGAAQAPDLKALRTLTQCLAQTGRAARGDSAAMADANGSASAGGASGAHASGVPGVPGTIASRDDALRALDRVCEWIERHEPTNPAPLLIRRAKRLMTKSFLDIIRDLAPDGLSQVERIAGVDGGGNE